jgi:hypothetical protein
MAETLQELKEEVFEIIRKRKITHYQVWPKMEEAVSPSTKEVDRTTMVQNLFLREIQTSPM